LVLVFVFSFNFSILKVGFEYKKLTQLFNIFVFYEYEYNGIFVNIVKTKSYFYFSDVMCVSEKNYFLKKNKKNNDQTLV